MNNEEKILEMLNRIMDRQDKTDVYIAQLQDKTEASIAQLQDKTEASIAQLSDEMNARFDSLESDMKYAWQDIALVEKRIKLHEKEYHEAV